MLKKHDNQIVSNENTVEKYHANIDNKANYNDDKNNANIIKKPKTTKKKSEDDDWDKPSNSVWAPWRNVTTAAIPNIAALTLRSFLGVTTALYVLNQKHLLPQPLSAVVSKALFWPTLRFSFVIWRSHKNTNQASMK